MLTVDDMHTRFPRTSTVSINYSVVSISDKSLASTNACCKMFHSFIKRSVLRFCAHLFLILSVFLTPSHYVIATTNPWDTYNQAPTSRTLHPLSIYATSGTVYNTTALLSRSSTRLIGTNSSVTVDFGKEVAGIITLSFAGASDANQTVGLAFSESSSFVGTTSDASSGADGTGNTDGAIYASVKGSGAGTYTVPIDKLRGGFRYLTLFLSSTGWVGVNGVSLNFTASPNMTNPAAYPNYFYCSDDLLNRIWYAGAYTVQLDTINPKQGHVWPAPSSGWETNATVGVGSEVLVDGAKRDRVVWPGDMDISTATAYVSTGDLLSTKNSLTTMYQNQNNVTGELPYSGPPFNGYSSDTYHMWTLIGTYNYYLYSANKEWLDGIWLQYQQGMTFITNKIDGNGLLFVTGTNDWARADQGSDNIEANVLLYQALTTGTVLAETEGNSTLAKTYEAQATNLKIQINNLLWNATAGAFQDNPNNTNLYPQDGNSLAVWYGVANTSAKVQSILSVLQNNWNNLGSQSPEWNNNISPYIGSMEVKARFEANDDQNALTLIRIEWGYMLNDPHGTNSTMWEAYSSTGELAFGSFTSMAHGWSTGPTSALTNYVLGIAPDTAGGQEYHVIPHPGDLTHVEGSLMVAQNKSITATYDIDGCGKFSMTVDCGSNSNSTGVIGVPLFGQNHAVEINGYIAWNGTAFQGADGVSSADQDGHYVYFLGVQPGKYILSYTTTSCNSTRLGSIGQ